MQEDHNKTRMRKLLAAASFSAVLASFGVFLFQLWAGFAVVLAYADSREALERLPHYSRCIVWCAVAQFLLIAVVFTISDYRIRLLTKELKKRDTA